MTPLSTPHRRGTDSNKWKRYPSDVLPLWVADMDFAVDPNITQAIRHRLDHPVLGYGSADDALRQTICEAITRDYDWKIEPEWLVFLPGVEPGFNMALHAFTAPGDGLVQELPVYAPLQATARFWKLDHRTVWQQAVDGQWSSDFDALAAAAKGARAWILCNPQNPTGRIYSRTDLARIGQLAIENDLLLISDEIHCGLTLDGRRHCPIASLSPEIADRTITLMAASKTWNIAGLKAAFAIVPNAARREAFNAARLGLVDSVNVLGLTAMGAAYGQGGAWRATLLAQLAETRDLLSELVTLHFPRAKLIPAEASFLAFIDFSAYQLQPSASAFFLEQARVGLSNGADFGGGLEGWVRLNFGCSTDLLREAIQRMADAIAARDRGVQ